MPKLNPASVKPLPQAQTQQPLPQQPAPQPWPGALSGIGESVGPSPKKKAADHTTFTETISANADARAEQALQMEATRLGMTVAEFKRKMKAMEANGGVDTTVDQDTSAGHVISLETELGILDDIRKHDPKALRPSWGEKITSAFTKDPDYLSFSKSEQRQRATAAYRNIIESALWLKTGAAYNPEQLQGQIESLMPLMDDGRGALSDKKLRLMSLIETARTRAGPANTKVQAALDRLKAAADDMYAPYYEPSNAQEYGQEGGLSTNGTKAVKIDPRMQEEYSAFMQGQKPGQLTPEAYKDFVTKLYGKYGVRPGELETHAANYVKAFNEGKPVNSTLSLGEEQLGPWQSMLNDAAQSPLGTGIMEYANAVTAGAPSGLAGDEGRYLRELATEKNPGSALAGDLLGSLVGNVGGEALLAKGIGKIAPSAAAHALGIEVGANAGYSGLRGANEAHSGEGWKDAALEAGMSIPALFAGKAVMQGARGFQSDETAKRLARFTEDQKFDIPAERGALEVGPSIPPEFQGMTDAQLQGEIARAEKGIKVHENLATSNADNAQKQALFIKENFRSNNPDPGQLDALKAEAEKRFPTNQTASGLEEAEILRDRIGKLENYLSQSGEPTIGTIPGAKLTNMQQMGLGRTEPFFEGLPGVHGGRQASMGEFHRNLVGRLLSKIGVELPETEMKSSGQALNDFVYKTLDSKYQELAPAIKGTIDPTFNNQATALVRQLKGIKGNPERLQAAQELSNIVENFKRTGQFNSESFRDFNDKLLDLSTLSNDAGLIDKELAQKAGAMRDNLLGLLGRNNPDAGARLKNLNEAWAHMKRVNRASTSASAMAERGDPSPTDYLAAIKALDSSVDKDAIARGRGFDQEWAQDANDVFGPRPVKKGSLKETGIGLGLTAGALATKPWLALPAAGLAANYTPGFKQLVEHFLLKGHPSKLIGKAVPDKYEPVVSDAAKQLLTQYLMSKGR